MRKKSKLILGVGVNDSESPVSRHKVVGGSKKQVWLCPYYKTWRNMMMRAYSDAWAKSYSTYETCVVAEDWHLFSTFKKWMESQDWKGKQLDKDILSVGEKIYSPNTCAFIDQALNKFMNDYEGGRGEMPTGVRGPCANGSFYMECSNPFIGEKEYYGGFDCPEYAHEAWRKRKHELACQYANMQSDQRIADALRKRYA